MSANQSPAPANVVAAIARIMEELPGIGKTGEAAKEQGGYKYRGIEAITAEIQKLMGRHGVVFIPHELTFSVEPITVGNKPWTETTISIEYDVYGPGGVEDRLPDRVGPIYAIGRDNSDKGANKCRTQAYKYALLHVFCIGDPKDDPDGATHEADARQAQPQTPPKPHPAEALVPRITNASDEHKAAIKQFVTDNGWPTLPKDWTEEHCDAISRKLDALTGSSENAPAPQGAGSATSDAEAGGDPTPPSASPSEWDRDSLLAGIKAYEERLDETSYPTYTGWLADTYGDAGTVLTNLTDIDLEQVWRFLEDLVTEGAKA